MNFLSIFWTFFKIGAFTIGGGYAMLPLVQHEICDVKGWLSNDDFLDSISLTNSLPGAMILNAGAFIGYRLKKLKGSVAAVLGSVMPSLIIITIIAVVFGKVIDNKFVAAFFSGVKPAVIVIMISAVIKLAKSAKLKDFQNLAVCIIAFLLMAFLDISCIIIILAAAAFALIMNGIKLKGGKHE